MFINPCKVTRVTSGFRTAKRPDHHGVDFALPGMHKIVAIADGTVTKSYVSNSYGETVFVLHNVDGQFWESVYAHLRKGSRKVKKGDKITRGDVLGIMGNTGRSFGQHLHFELHKGRWNMEKSNAVDPLKYFVSVAKPSSKPAPKAPGIKSIGKIKITGVKSVAIVMDKPDRVDGKNIGLLNKNSVVKIAGSVKGENNPSGYWEIIYKGKRAYISSQYGKRV